ncbi:MAG: hypothetical protein Alis3KO_31360 [Aliiglaciecola sp.]
MLEQSFGFHSKPANSDSNDTSPAKLSSELPVLTGMKDAENSSLRLDISESDLKILRNMN